jgi:hypothetical protein
MFLEIYIIDDLPVAYILGNSVLHPNKIDII